MHLGSWEPYVPSAFIVCPWAQNKDVEGVSVQADASSVPYVPVWHLDVCVPLAKPLVYKVMPFSSISCTGIAIWAVFNSRLNFDVVVIFLR